jgi:hypothetical protein
MTRLLPDMAERYWQLLIAGDADGLLDMFERVPAIDDERNGRVEGEDAARDFVAETHEWLRGMKAHISPVRTTRGESRTVAEQELHLDVDGKDVHLPTAVVAERTESPRLSRLSAYHSTWPLTGHHSLRRPFLEVDPDIKLPDVVGRYMEGLAQGYLAGVLGVFESDAYVREPSGEPYVYRGEDQLREFYITMFGNVGGIDLDHCTVTDDGEAVAVEYNVLKWGRTPLPAQAGVAVYERGSSGLLKAARIYDDVEPPLESSYAAASELGAERG